MKNKKKKKKKLNPWLKINQHLITKGKLYL